MGWWIMGPGHLGADFRTPGTGTPEGMSLYRSEILIEENWNQLNKWVRVSYHRELVKMAAACARADWLAHGGA